MNVKKLSAEDVFHLFKSIQDIDETLMVEIEKWNLDNFLYDLPEKWNLSHFAFIDDKLVGYLICSKKEESFHIHRFVVSTKYQNKGVGSLLLNTLVHSIPQSSFLTLKVKKYNLQAISFYNQNGFEKFAEEGVNYLYIKTV